MNFIITPGPVLRKTGNADSLHTLIYYIIHVRGMSRRGEVFDNDGETILVVTLCPSPGLSPDPETMGRK